MRLGHRFTLAFVLLGCCVSAAEHPDRKTKKHRKVPAEAATDVDASPVAPYTAFAWDGSTPATAHVQPMVLFSQVWVDPVTVAKQMLALPAGRRVGLGFCMTDPLWGRDTLTEADGTPTQSPWCDNGVAAMHAAYGDWFAQYTAAGGPQPDFLAMDDEETFSAWAINAAQSAAIAADPRYPAVAAEWEVTGITPGSYSPTWDNAMAGLKDRYISAAMDGTVENFSNYGDVWVPAALSPQYLDVNGCPVYSTTTLGEYQSPAFYAWVGNLAIAGHNDGTNPDFASDLLATVIWQADNARVAAESPMPVIPWFAYRSYADTGSWPVYIANTPYWDEMVLHVLMSCGSSSCFTWNPNSTDADNAALESDMAALEKKCGSAATVTPIGHDLTPYDAPVLVSGVTAGSRQVFRVTVQNLSAREQTVKVTLPGEKAESTIRIPGGELGVWLVKN